MCYVALATLLACGGSDPTTSTGTGGSGGDNGSDASAEASTGGSGGMTDGEPCTITSTHPDPTCEQNCAADPETEAGCLSLCSDVTTKTAGISCNDVCLDDQNDSKNCGGCGNVCQHGSGCANSSASGFCISGVCDCNR
jgi:hypothetical protein